MISFGIFGIVGVLLIIAIELSSIHQEFKRSNDFWDKPINNIMVEDRPDV